MSRPRKINSLVKAELVPEGPPFPTNLRARGAAARGLAYQRHVVRTIQEQLDDRGTIHEGPWIRYHEQNGTYWCQPDIVVETANRSVIIEVKLSLRRLGTALKQLNGLYRPCVEFIFGRPVTACVAFRHWTPDADHEALGMIDDPRELLWLGLLKGPGPFGWHLL